MKKQTPNSIFLENNLPSEEGDIHRASSEHGVHKLSRSVRHRINDLLDVLSEANYPEVHVQRILAFKEEPDDMQRLCILRDMSIPNAIEAIQLCCPDAASHYLEERLAHYESLVLSRGGTDSDDLEDVKEQLKLDILYASTLQNNASDDSIAKTAVELEQHFNGTGDARLKDIIDWLSASPEMISAAAQALQSNKSDEEILANLLMQQLDAEPTEHNLVRQLVQFATADPVVRNQLQELPALKAKLAEHGYRFSLYDFLTLARNRSSTLLEVELNEEEHQEVNALIDGTYIPAIAA